MGKNFIEPPEMNTFKHQSKGDSTFLVIKDINIRDKILKKDTSQLQCLRYNSQL